MESVRELYKTGKGPSSSHTMGPARAAREFSDAHPEADSFRAVLFGSLALTGKGHLTDVALLETFAPRPCTVEEDRTRKDLPHPNYFELYALRGGEILAKQAYLSVGGGTVRRAEDGGEGAREVYPFADFSAILRYAQEKKIPLEQIVYDFEGDEVKGFLAEVWHTMQSTVKRGLCASGKLPGALGVERRAKTLFETVDEDEDTTGREQRHLCAFAFAVSEENAAGGTIVTAPTCGSCGVLPAVLCFLAAKHGFSENRIVDALAVAGLVGVTVKQNASISGAEAGCQAEVGTATAMAAAATGCLFRADPRTIEYAAEIALEHQLGLTCDPVGGYVQIPCIERNAVAATRAINAYALSKVLAGTRKIDFDTVVATMYATGKDLSVRYRETSEGGLAAKYRC